MPPSRTPALPLALYDFSNTSQIVVLFTRDLGKVRGLAKGAKRATGSFQGGFDLGAVYEVTLIEKTEGLDLLTKAEMTEGFPGLRRNLAALEAAFYVLELAAELTVEHDPQPEFWQATVDTLRLLDKWAPRDIVLFAFEAAAMRQHGFMPRVDDCAVCGRPLPPRPAFSPRFGGALCTVCAPMDPGARAVSAGGLKMMARLAEGTIPLQSLNVDGRVGKDLRAAFDLFWLNLFGRELRSARFVR
ncbi:MAG: DNA repair protein RecO [Planctomycetes bacterium]|nr:DNA repair protein RecO [Planctomycetota bacterium]